MVNPHGSTLRPTTVASLTNHFFGSNVLDIPIDTLDSLDVPMSNRTITRRLAASGLPSWISLRELSLNL
ncbi:hypothetical protein TNCV_1819581 [Trichonephila clavipes]|nr:hypothetical protein TNCV_1819581 [Trichonephila clavipes]